MRSLNDALHAVAEMFSLDGTAAFKFFMAAAGTASAYLLDQDAERAAFFGSGIVVALDTVTGVLAAHKTGKPISSQGLARALSKSAGYFSVVLLAAVVEHTIAVTVSLPIVTTVLWFVIATEGLSILENVRKMGLADFPMLSKILDGVIRADSKNERQPSSADPARKG